MPSLKTTQLVSENKTFPFKLNSNLHQSTSDLCGRKMLETMAGDEGQIIEKIDKMLNPCLLCGLVLHPLLASPLPSLDAHPLCLRFLR